MNNVIEIHFTHPRDSKVFTAEISPDCTGQQAVEGLIDGDSDGPFLDPPQQGRPYELNLKRISKTITPNMSFAQAGAISGDTVEVLQRGRGA
jgi:hypothetical protein